MKIFFYTTSLLSILSIIIGVIRFDNFRDRLYLLAMLLMFLAIIFRQRTDRPASHT